MVIIILKCNYVCSIRTDLNSKGFYTFEMQTARKEQMKLFFALGDWWNVFSFTKWLEEETKFPFQALFSFSTFFSSRQKLILLKWIFFSIELALATDRYILLSVSYWKLWFSAHSGWMETKHNSNAPRFIRSAATPQLEKKCESV